MMDNSTTQSMDKAFTSMADIMTSPDEEEICQLPLDQIEADKNQDRTTWQSETTQDHLRDLETSIKEVGVRFPILVQRIGDRRYKIIEGECRYRAAGKVGLRTIPAIIRRNDEKTASMDQLIADINKLKLSPLEVAEALKKRLSNGFSRKDISRVIGKSEPWISKHLAILEMPSDVQRLAWEGVVTDPDNLAQVAKIPEKDREEYIQKIRDKEMTLKEVKEVVGDQKKKDSRDVAHQSIPPKLSATIAQVQTILQRYYAPEKNYTSLSEKEIVQDWKAFLEGLTDH